MRLPSWFWGLPAVGAMLSLAGIMSGQSHLLPMNLQWVLVGFGFGLALGLGAWTWAGLHPPKPVQAGWR